MSDTTIIAENLASVTPIRPISAEARPLVYRGYEQEPSLRQPLAHMAWRIEQQLGVLWDEQLSPHVLLEQFAPAKAAAAAPLLDDVFAASDAAAVVAIGIAPGAWSPVFDEYTDAMYELAFCLRGTR